MLFVVSPAKNLDYESPTPTTQFTQPTLLDYSQRLIDICKTLSPQEIASLMHLSDKLAGLNAARFGEWQPPFTSDNARQALFAFNGDVYTGLDASSLSDKNIEYAQQHLRILSGLYGLLKPLDLMQAYRLEMGTKLANDEGSNLYHFWGDVITNELNTAISKVKSDHLINLASNEYFKSVKIKSLTAKVITPQFKDWKNGQYKIISFYAKKARGLMARYMIENEVKSIDALLKFDSAGYGYSEELSTDANPVFIRNIADS
ncbi:peroxide stress protein YaaA [Algibacillus agarilyticus]|uniref:peroxide stress protein YaaA n=1 Tax=Algibacillus agarilyticus TaxID=2234133 RepID=UPI000DCFC7E9|nr:peroxide stress protein YaaA [Algibacillus agarilyticus]